MQQLASPAGIGRSRQRRTSRYQESACIIRGSRQRMVPMDSQPPPEQGRRSTLVPISQELSTGYQGCSEFWRLPHRMVQQELQNDLPEYGAW